MMNRVSGFGRRVSDFGCTRVRRRGSLLFEAVAALAMLGVTLSLGVQMIIEVDRQASLRRQREVASRLLENELEQIVARPGDEITNQSLAELELPAEAQRLREAELTAAVQELAEPVASRRITLTLSWSPTQGADPRSLSLTTFVYDVTEATP